MATGLREACRALIVDETGSKVLLGRRADDDHYAAGRWSLFGGKVDDGETPMQAVIREMKEETGLDFIPHALLVQENDEWRTHFFVGTVAGKLSLRLAEHSEATFFSLDEMEGLPLAFDHLDVIRDYIHSLTTPGGTPYSA